jgi:hypothetical protein
LYGPHTEIIRTPWSHIESIENTPVTYTEMVWEDSPDIEQWMKNAIVLYKRTNGIDNGTIVGMMRNEGEDPWVFIAGPPVQETSSTPREKEPLVSATFSDS